MGPGFYIPSLDPYTQEVGTPGCRGTAADEVNDVRPGSLVPVYRLFLLACEVWLTTTH